jgi:hypothetical protein
MRVPLLLAACCAVALSPAGCKTWDVAPEVKVPEERLPIPDALKPARTDGPAEPLPPPAAPDAQTGARKEGPSDPPPPPHPDSSTYVLRRWDFDADPVGGPPAGFSFGRTGHGKAGSWAVRAAEGAPSGKQVLAQEDADATDYRFPVALVEGVEAKDLRLTVKYRTVSGVVDQAAGLVFRAKGEKDYYVARANALEGNVMLFRVKGGFRDLVAQWDGKVAAKEWTELGVDVAGDRIQVIFGGKAVLDVRDGTFLEAGKVGLWTKADAVTEFDDLMLEGK